MIVSSQVYHRTSLPFRWSWQGVVDPGVQQLTPGEPRGWLHCVESRVDPSPTGYKNSRSFRALLNSKDKEWNEQSIRSFMYVLMSTIWYKVLTAIDICNRIIQARYAMLDMEVSNIKTLLENLIKLQSKWKGIWNEAKEAASNLEMEIKLCLWTKMPDDASTPDSNLVEMTDTTDDSPEESYFRKTILCFDWYCCCRINSTF